MNKGRRQTGKRRISDVRGASGILRKGVARVSTLCKGKIRAL